MAAWGFHPLERWDGVNVEVYCPKPRFEIARDTRLFDMGQIIAKQKGIDWTECKVDRKLRIVVHTKSSEIIAHQSKESWVTSAGSP